MSATVLQVAGSRNPTEADLKKNGGIQYQDTVGSPRGQGQQGLSKDAARNGRQEPRGVFTHYHFSPLLSLCLLHSSFSTSQLFSCFSGHLVVSPQFPESNSQSHIYKSNLRSTSTFLIHLEGCQVLLVHSTVAMGWSHVHQHGCEVGVTVSSEPPKGIHSISDLSYGSCFSLWLVWPNSCSVLASHCQLLLSSLTDLEGLHSIFCSSKGEIFYIQSMVLEKHHCWQRVSRRTASLKKKKNLTPFCYGFSSFSLCRYLTELFLSVHQRLAASGEKPHITS